MKIVIKDNICEREKLTKNKEYEVLSIDDDMPITPDQYFKIRNDEGKEIWIDDWDCEKIIE